MANPSCNFKERIYQRRSSLCRLGTGIIFFIVLFLFTKIYQKPLCLAQNVLHIPCPGCGLTRGFIAIMQLDLWNATRLNCLSIPLFLGISLYAFLLIADIVFNTTHIQKLESILSKKWMLPLYFFLLGSSIFQKIQY